MQLYERFFNQLADEEQVALWNIHSPEDLKEVKRLALWMNDGIPCIGASINNIQIGFHWLGDGSEILEAFYHLEESGTSGQRAKEAVFQHLRMIRGANQAQTLDEKDDFNRDEDSFEDGAFDPYGDSDGESW